MNVGWTTIYIVPILQRIGVGKIFTANWRGVPQKTGNFPGNFPNNPLNHPQHLWFQMWDPLPDSATIPLNKNVHLFEALPAGGTSNTTNVSWMSRPSSRTWCWCWSSGPPPWCGPSVRERSIADSRLWMSTLRSSAVFWDVWDNRPLVVRLKTRVNFIDR